MVSRRVKISIRGMDATHMVKTILSLLMFCNLQYWSVYMLVRPSRKGEGVPRRQEWATNRFQLTVDLQAGDAGGRGSYCLAQNGRAARSLALAMCLAVSNVPAFRVMSVRVLFFLFLSFLMFFFSFTGGGGNDFSSSA